MSPVEQAIVFGFLDFEEVYKTKNFVHRLEKEVRGFTVAEYVRNARTDMWHPGRYHTVRSMGVYDLMQEHIKHDLRDRVNQHVE